MWFLKATKTRMIWSEKAVSGIGAHGRAKGLLWVRSKACRTASDIQVSCVLASSSTWRA